MTEEWTASDMLSKKTNFTSETILQDLRNVMQQFDQMMVDVIVDVILSDNQTSETFAYNLLRVHKQLQENLGL
jgi:hypothetical protein